MRGRQFNRGGVKTERRTETGSSSKTTRAGAAMPLTDAQANRCREKGDWLPASDTATNWQLANEARDSGSS
jgi:hypothetical protein